MQHQNRSTQPTYNEQATRDEIDDARRELATVTAYIAPSLAPGTDAQNDYWRTRRQNLRDQIALAERLLASAGKPHPSGIEDEAERDALAENDPDRCDACGALQLCDCAVYLT